MCRTEYLCLVFLGLTLVFLAPVGAEDSFCQARGDGRPQIEIKTALGPILIELDEAAIPRTLPQLVHHIEDDDPYQGRAFDYSKPLVEIALGASIEGTESRYSMEIDAEALGLHQQKIADPGEAMDLMQEKLFKTYQQHRRSGKVTPLLRNWIEKWYENRRADFLVGVSQKQVLEALGYVYERGLASKPVVRGAVTLKSSIPGEVTDRLSIVLTDIPSRTGRWMVIGKVVQGLEMASAISQLPLRHPRHSGRKYSPVEPVVLESLRFFCAETISIPHEEN